MNVEEIAKERELAIGTILGHLAVAIGEGRISIYKFMTHEEVASVENRVREMPRGLHFKRSVYSPGGKFNYGHLRAVMNHMRVSPSSLTIDSTDTHSG